VAAVVTGFEEAFTVRVSSATVEQLRPAEASSKTV